MPTLPRDRHDPFIALRTLLATTALCGTLSVALPAVAQTLPTGGRVVEGQATIAAPSGGRLDVTQTSPKAVVDWQSFSVGASGHVNFAQPGRDAVILNRVTTPNLPSDIQGRISANGQVWLVNPSGIFIGAGAKIDVAGFLATTHDIANADFMAGRYRFGTGTQPTGSVENEGTITIAEAGLAALVAPHVANRGVIAARLGQVTLASGNAFTVDFAGDGLISFAVTAPVTAPVLGRDGKVVPALVENAGQIHADGGRVLLTANAAKGIVERAVSMSGVVQARSITRHADGTIELLGEGAGRVEVSGLLDATAAEAAAKGGMVTVTGETVGLVGTASVDASGPGGGGEVRIGGDYLGGRATPARLADLGVIPAKKPVRNAEVVYVGPEARIRADATVAGKGGQVVVWSDDTTRTHGQISARGGREGGDGGFVETSGRRHLTATRAADASAPAGKAGTWLLDPTNITIGSMTPTDGSSLVAASSVVEALEGGTSIEILTSAGSGAGAGDIVLAVPLTVGEMSGAATLTLTAAATAAGSVRLQEAITATDGTLSLVIESGTTGDVVFGADVTIAGSLTATAGGTLSQTAGTVSAGAINLNATTAVVQAAGATLTTGTPASSQGFGASGNLSLIAGSATLSGAVSAAGTLTVTASTGAIALNAGGSATANVVRMTGAHGGAAITLAGPVTAAGSGGIAVGGTGDLTVGGALTAATGPVFLSAFGSGTVSVGAAVSGTDVWIEGGAITVAEEITVSSSGATGQIGLVADTLTLDGTVAGGAQGSVTLAPRTLSRSIGLGAGAGDYAVTATMLDKVTGGGHLVVGLPTSTGTITVAGTDPVEDEGPIGLNFGRATTLRGGTIALETPVVAPSLALLAGTAITQDPGATITTEGTLVLGRSSGTRPTMTLGSAVSAGGDLWIHAGALTIGSAVSAAGRMVVDVNGTDPLTVAAGGSLTSSATATDTDGTIWLRAGSGGMQIAGTVNGAGTGGISLLSSGTMTVDGTVTASAGLLHVEGTGTAGLTVAGTLTGHGGVAVLLAGGDATTTGTGQIVTPGEFRFDTAGTDVAVSHGESEGGSVANVSLAGTHLVNGETVASTGVFESWNFEGSSIDPWAGSGALVTKTGAGGASGSTQVAQVTASGTGTYVSMSLDITGALAGQVLSGWVRFVGADYLPFNDDGRFTVTGGSTSVLYSKSISQVGNYGVDAWTRVSYVLPAPGTYTLRAQVRNVNDGNLASRLQIDDWLLRAAFPTAATAPTAPTAPGVLTTPIVAPASPPPPPVVVSPPPPPPPPPVVSPPPPVVESPPPPPTVETPVVVSPPPPPTVETPVVVSPPPPPTVETPVVVSPPPPPTVATPVAVSPPHPPPTVETPVVVSPPPPPTVETPVVVSPPPPPPTVETPVVVSPPPPPTVETPVVVSPPPPPTVETPVAVSPPPPPPPTTQPLVATVVQQVAALTQQAGPEVPIVQSPQIVVASPPPPPVATVASTTPTGPLVPPSAPPATASTLPAEVRSPAFQAVATQVASTLTTGNLAGGLQQISNLGLSNVQTQAVFAQVPATQLVSGLASSGSPALQSVAAPMQSLLSGGGSFAEVRSAIQASGADPTTARTLEVMALAVKKENRTQAFSGAIQQLQTDPNVATTFGTPSGTSPSVPPKIEQVRVTTDPGSGQARVVGQLEEVSAFPTLRVNGRWVFVDDQGRFDATVPPLAGTNAVIVAATNEQSAPAVQTFTQQGGSQTGAAGAQRWVQVAADVSDDDLRELAQAAREQAPQVAGRRYAIVIANADYRDDSVPDLGTPHADARLVAGVLTRRYGFEVDVQLDKTRNEIFDALRALGRKLKEEDQVAIYYAGHGYSFYGSDLAYWLPVDAETTRANAWISSADISKLLHRMPARQILLISDSCYSGGFAEAIPEGNRSEDLQALLGARAVMTVTSGGDEPVEDGADNSPFAKTLADELETAASATNMLRLFERIRDRVMAESPQTPNYGVVSFAGYDDGADFVLTQR